MSPAKRLQNLKNGSLRAVGRSGEFGSIGKQTWIFLVLFGISTGLSWLCYFRALKVGEVSKVAPIHKLSVVVARVLAILFFRERIKARGRVDRPRGSLARLEVAAHPRAGEDRINE